jgi:hypothetical protein
MKYVILFFVLVSCDVPQVKPKTQEVKLINLSSNKYYTIQVKANGNTWYPSYLPILK